jgi:aminoglycoside 6-adenylyltransferase
MTPEQRLERIAAWAAEEGSVSAVFVVGSRARTSTPADEYSDTDVVLICDDPERLIADEAWFAAFGTPVLSFVEATALGGRRERRVLYDDGADVDLVPVTVEDVASVAATAGGGDLLRRGVRVLVDKDGELATLLNAPTPDADGGWLPPAPDVANLISDFWYHLLWTARKLRRGELWIAHECLNDNLLHTLRRFIEWEALAVSRGEADTWFRGRYLERWARPDTLERLAAASARYDDQDVRRALLAAADLFSDLAPPIALAAGADYPAEGERLVRELVSQTLS